MPNPALQRFREKFTDYDNDGGKQLFGNSADFEAFLLEEIARGKEEVVETIQSRPLPKEVRTVPTYSKAMV